MGSVFTRVLYIVGVVGTSACTRQLAPASIPAAIAPVVHVVGPPAPGTGRLIVDVAEGPVPVYRGRLEARKQDSGTRHPTFRFFDLPPELICKETPCVIDEPPGNILIGFPVLGCGPAIDYDLVHVGLDPSIYRRSLGIFEDETGAERIIGIVMASVGAGAAITGTALLPAGLSKDNDGLTAAGGITLGAGALLTTIGVLLIRHDSATYRPGSANHFDGSSATDRESGSPPPSRRSPFEVFPNYECSWTSRRGGAG
ncbi:MAG: hypothetical protein AB7O24_07520 [Kofleriaceae bacterium]